MDKIVIIGYSGHSYVCIDAALSSNTQVEGYFETELLEKNPYGLKYLGSEDGFDYSKLDQDLKVFVSIGSNTIRSKVYKGIPKNKNTSIIHQTSIISPKAKLGDGLFISANAIINSMAIIGDGVILNTGSIVEHECVIGEFSHIAPGAVLAGNVTVGDHTMIGANAVVKQGIRIGSNVMVGAGAVVVKDIEDGAVVAGNPAINLKK
jgi:sugar O-acyltransferase (sialic acid O-acetyltransferase NeuD family)